MFQSRRHDKIDEKIYKLRGQGWRWPVQKYRQWNEDCCSRKNFSRTTFSSSSRVAHNGKRAAIKFTTWPRWLSCIYSWSFSRESSRNFRVERFYTSMIFILFFSSSSVTEADFYNYKMEKISKIYKYLF